MELTTSRMDTYLIVGTLLLDFGVGWYVENKLFQAALPEWYCTLFHISNFCCVGYLVISVWLAMHASVVSHSMGVRLLTGYARLPIPKREELHSIRVSMTPFLKAAMANLRGSGFPDATSEF